MDPFDPRENIMAGTRLLRELLDQHRGNLRLAIASYNAGPTAVARYGRCRRSKKPRTYVKKVTGLIADARGPRQQQFVDRIWRTNGCGPTD